MAGLRRKRGRGGRWPDAIAMGASPRSVPGGLLSSPPPLFFLLGIMGNDTTPFLTRTHTQKQIPPSPPLYHTFWLALLSLPRNDIYARAPALPPPAATPMTGNAAAADISPGAVGWVPWKQRAP